MREEAQPLSSIHTASAQSRAANATDVTPESSLMHGEQGQKRGKKLERHARSMNGFWQDTWAPEVLSCIVALSALIGMAITLKMRQDRPVPHWPSGISLNTVVAVFSAVMKAALIMPVGEGISQLKFLWFRKNRTLADLEDFDNASRGPWGSFRFMFQLKSHYLATLGAFITVAALAVDPFAQQILQYYSCSIAVPGQTASIPRNNNFTADTIVTFTAGGQRSLDEKMAGSIWLGVLQPPQNLSSQINVQCPSGNCTFPANSGATYDTIAMCSSCSDISNQIVNLTESDGVYNYTLPLSSKSANDSMNIGRSVSFRSRIVDTPDLLAFESIMFTKDDLSCNDTKQACRVNAFATHCSLIPCVQSYKADMKSFTLDEELVSSTNMIYDAHSDGMLGSFSLVTNSTIRNGVQHDCITSKENTPENTVALTWNNTKVTGMNQRNITHWVSPDCFFQFDLTSQATREFLWSMYTEQSLSFPYNNIYNSIGDLWIKRFYHKGTANLTTSNEYMNGLAIAMSAQMRRGHDASQDAIGTVLAQQRCVHIEWAWICLPASLVLMSILFLAATIWSSLTQAWHGMWKSSSLALIFASLESEILLHSGTLDRKSQMSNSANEIEVQFMKTERGWGFVEQ